jgi:hypothetical protein
MLEIEDIAEVVAVAVREATGPLLLRIDALEKREMPLLEKGEPGEPGRPGEPGAPGEVDMDAVRRMIGDAVSSLPPAEKGEPGEPGRDVDMGEVVTRIETAVSAAVAALPAPKAGDPGKDGIGLADALRDAEGHLILVMTDGRTKSLGLVNGKDGEPGRDGLGFDDLQVEQIGERTVRFLLKRDAGEAEFDVTFPVPIYRGVFKEGEPYEAADLVTWAGSLWHCNEPKGLKPGAPDSGWQLAAKAGRPGKDAAKCP